MGNPSQHSDGDLLLSFCKKGDEAAFTHLVQRHHAMMYRSALRVLGNHEDARDALQATLIVFARKAPELHGHQSLGAWLHRVVLLESANLRRKKSRRRHHETQAMKQHQPSSSAKPSDLLPELDHAIDSLKPKDRTVVVLHHLEGQTFPAIAKELGGSAEGWRKRCTRALEQLSRKLGRKGTPIALTALATLLSQQQSQAVPVSAQVLQGLTREALTHSTITTKSTVALLLMNSKLILLSAFLGGGLLSLAYNPAPTQEAAQPQKTSAHSPSSNTSRSNPRPRRATGYSLDAVLTAIGNYDSSPERDLAQEKSLRLLMFSVPAKDIPSVLNALYETSHRDYFQDIVTSLYARWTELDPDSAWASAREQKEFLTQARRGVLVTWLSRDSEAALNALLETPHESNLKVLSEFLGQQVQHSPHDAAQFVDRVSESWPRADKALFQLVASAWAMQDPDSAGEWIASHHDVQAREALLNQLARKAAWGHGLQALTLADRIETP